MSPFSRSALKLALGHMSLGELRDYRAAVTDRKYGGDHPDQLELMRLISDELARRVLK